MVKWLECLEDEERLNHDKWEMGCHFSAVFLFHVRFTPGSRVDGYMVGMHVQEMLNL